MMSAPRSGQVNGLPHMRGEGQTDLIEREVRIVHIPLPHVDPAMGRVRDAVDAHLGLARAQLLRARADALHDLRDGHDGAEDVRARGERDEARLGRDEREERVELQADGVAVVRIGGERGRAPELGCGALALGEALPRPRVR